MATQVKPLTNEQKELLKMMPIWDERVWRPLQKKEWKTAMDKFYTVLGYYTRKTIADISWKSIIEGAPYVRGKVSKSEWQTEVVPYLSLILLNIADTRLFENIYSSLGFGDLLDFHTALVREIPGETAEEKLKYTKEKNEWLYNFFLASPLGIICDGLLLPIQEGVKRDIQDISLRMRQFPEKLSVVFFSPEEAQIVREFAETYNLTENQITEFAYVLGLILVGIVSPENLSSEIRKINANFENEEEFENFITETNEFFIEPVRKEINDLKDMVESAIPEKEMVIPIATEEGAQKETQIKVNKVSFPTPEAPERPKTDENTPLILRKEDSETQGEKKGGSVFSKGFSLPFGFFKKREVTDKKGGVAVSIQTAPKIASEIKATTPSVFQRIREKEKKIPEKNTTETVISSSTSIFEKIRESEKKNEDKKTAAPEKTKQVHYSSYTTPIDAPSEQGPLIIK